MFVKILACLMALCFAYNAKADDVEIVDSGEVGTDKACGDNCSWTLDDQGTLTISGIGQMYNYEATCETSPCSANYPWPSNVQKVVINEGITSVGKYAFVYAHALTSVSLPSTIQEIKTYAFHNTSALSKINLPEGLKTIGKEAFSTSPIDTLVVPSTIKSINPVAFYRHYDDEYAHINKIFCHKDMMDLCEAVFVKQNITPIPYETAPNGKEFFYNGHFYSDPNDILKPDGYIKKRIYTIDEANTVTGPINRISIKYR